MISEILNLTMSDKMVKKVRKRHIQARTKFNFNLPQGDKNRKTDEEEIIRNDRWPSLCSLLLLYHWLQLVLHDPKKSAKDHQHQ